jgi:hypothetical protein
MPKNLVALTSDQIRYTLALIESHTEKLATTREASHSGVDQFVLDSALITYREIADELSTHLPVSVTEPGYVMQAQA